MNSDVEIKRRIEGLTGQRPRFVRETIPVPELGPEAFLRAASGRARGFWDRGKGWVAHVGEAAAIVIGAGQDAAGRFQEVERRAAALVNGAWDRPPPRFYGGFSFRDDHEAKGIWGGFPVARFVLPEVELECSPAGRRLSAQSLLDPGADEDEARHGLGTYLEGLRTRLIEGQTRSSRAPTPQSATRVESDRDRWESAVEDALEVIRSGEVSKVVLARTLDVSTPRPLDPLEVLRNLRDDSPGSHVFFYEPEPGVVLLGAAPEVVATVRGRTFRATAVAGSAPVGKTAELQEFWANELLTSEKDRVEHAYTVEDMIARLRPLSKDVAAEPEPHVLTLRRIQHLETRIDATLAGDHHVLSLVESLHPTPAVCGYPRDAALNVVAREEPFERGWYAGPVGWFDVRGDGVFVPALRCAVSHSGSWRLFAGAGIVPGSVPGLEWKETAIKFEPVLQALYASGAS